MPDKFKDTLMLPVAIPTWSLVSALAIGVFSAGTIYSEIKSLSVTSQKNETKLELVFERQLVNIAEVQNLRQAVTTLERRVYDLERNTLVKYKEPR